MAFQLRVIFAQLFTLLCVSIVLSQGKSVEPPNTDQLSPPSADLKKPSNVESKDLLKNEEEKKYVRYLSYEITSNRVSQTPNLILNLYLLKFTHFSIFN